MSAIKMGFGASKITPEIGAFMAGYFHERQATAVHDDLFAKAMIFDVGFVSIPAEYFVELQLDIKKHSPFKRTFVSELANGWVGYIPTKKAFDENMKDVPADAMKQFDHKGYEVRSALSRGFLPGVGEVMADKAVELLEKLYITRNEK
jgi:hypothetical protein